MSQISLAVSEEAHRVTCPYCQQGFALVDVQVYRGEKRINVAEPRQCGSCGRWFKLRPKVMLVGYPLDIDRQGTIRINVREYDPDITAK